MRKAIKYCYVAVLMTLVYYYVSILFIFIPSTSTLNRTINIVTDTVKTVRNCDKYIVPFILNGKISQYTVWCPHRLDCRNFGKANRCGHVKILILFMTKAVDIII